MKRKGLICAIVILLVMLCGCEKKGTTGTAVNVPAEENAPVTVFENENGGTDVVLLMDESGSMVKSDKERMAIEGAKLFVDMEKSKDSSIALVEFSNEIKSSDLLEANQQNKEEMKQILDAVQYSGTAHTDTGAGLLEAVSLLANSGSENNNKAIILFTDGKTDIDVGTPGRTTEDSLNDVELAIQKAKESGYKVFCIGLNADGKVDEQMLQNIATTTGGNYKVATDVNELPDFFNSIFADMDQSEKQELAEFEADGNYYEVHFKIDNNSVLEANIVILSSRGLEDIILTNPIGDIVSISDESNISFSTSDSYSLIKLFYPESGEWIVRVKGVSGDHIKVSLISNYDIEVAVDLTKLSATKGDEILLDAYLVTQGERLSDAQIYETLSGKLFVEDVDLGEVKEYELSLNQEKNALSSKLDTSVCGTYQGYVHVEGSGFYRESDSFVLHVTKEPPIIVEEIDKIEILLKDKKELNLSSYFADPDGDEVLYDVDNNNDFLDIEIHDGKMILTATEEGNGFIDVIAENGAENVTKQRVEVVTLSFMQVYGWLIALLVLLIVIGLVCWVNNKKSKRIYGSFRTTITSYVKNQYGTFDSETYDVWREISAEQIGKYGFKLSDLFKLLPGYFIADEQAAKEALIGCIAKMTEAKQIAVRPQKKAYCIVVKNASKAAKFVHLGSVSDRKELVVDLNSVNMGISTALEKEFAIRYVINSDMYYQVNIKYKKV